MRRGCVGIGTLAALAIAAGPAAAANQTVTATAGDQFTPVGVTVLVGESVTWNNAGGLHNVRFDDGSYVMPPTVSSAAWSVSRTFNSTGTFRYYCEAHGGPNGSGMAGAVTVQAAGTAPGSSPGQGPGQAQPVTADRTAPALTLGGPRGQRALRRGAVLVAVRVDEAATVVAGGRVSVPGASRTLRLRRVSRRLAAGAKANLRLRLSQRSLRIARRALTRRPRLTARLSVTATDTAGNRRSARRKVTLRR